MNGCYCCNPMVQMYNYNMGRFVAMNQIQQASIMSMPTVGAGDSSPFNMDYPLVGGFMPFGCCGWGMRPMPFVMGGFF